MEGEEKSIKTIDSDRPYTRCLPFETRSENDSPLKLSLFYTLSYEKMFFHYNTESIPIFHPYTISKIN